jgi:hypothetical protein
LRYNVTDEQLQRAVLESESMAGVLRVLGIRLAGGSYSHYSSRIKKLGLDTSHFTGKSSNKGKKFPRDFDPDDILILRESGSRQKSNKLVRAMLESGIIHECSKCGIGPEWLGNPLTLDVDHINENWLDDRLGNLRFLCPNCHSQFSRNLLGK